MSEIMITDSIKGIANVSLTPSLAFNIGRAFATTVLQTNKEEAKILVGKDTRASGDMLEAAFCAGAASLGVSSVRIGIIPSPAISALVVKYKMTASVMIGASDSSAEYNAISFYDSQGKKMSDEALHNIMNYATGKNEIAKAADPAKVGRIKRTHIALRDYCDYVKTFATKPLGAVKLAVDAANGSAFECAKIVFSELGADVEMINNRPDGLNINQNCGISDTNALASYIKEHQRSFGIAYSGDADAFCLLDSEGIRICAKSGDAMCESVATLCENI